MISKDDGQMMSKESRYARNTESGCKGRAFQTALPTKIPKMIITMPIKIHLSRGIGHQDFAAAYPGFFFGWGAPVNHIPVVFFFFGRKLSSQGGGGALLLHPTSTRSAPAFCTCPELKQSTSLFSLESTGDKKSGKLH